MTDRRPPLPAVLHPAFPPGVDEALSEVDGIDLAVASDEDQVVALLAERPLLVTFRWEDRFLTPALRWVQSISAGVEQFPQAQFTARGVVLSSAQGVHGPQVAEHAFALLLALTRNVGISMRDAEQRQWRPRMAYELSGRTLAVLGLGVIGEEVARRGAAWGMRVIGLKASPQGYRGVAEEVAGPDSLVEVLQHADVAVSVLPDTQATRGLIDAGALSALGSGWLVNVGRGTAVVEEDLLTALDHGALLGAGLDVFATEPLPPESPLWTHPRVVVTPHIGGLSPHYGPRLARILDTNLEAFLAGGTWLTRVI